MAKNRVVTVIGIALVVQALGLIVLWAPPEHAADARNAFGVLAVALVILMVVFVSRAQTSASSALRADGGVVRKGPVTIDGVGGVLMLTEGQLVFSSHGFLQKAAISAWDLRDFERATLASSLGVIPNRVDVQFVGATVRLVVTEREGWLRDINAAAERARST